MKIATIATTVVAAASAQQQLQAQPPRDCTSWNDGCNTCSVRGGAIGGCTMMMCLRAGNPFCAAFADGRACTSAASCTRSVVGGDSGSDGFNCCGGGAACGFVHCPALGAGQAGCVQPWAMPNGLTLETCASSHQAIFDAAAAAVDPGFGVDPMPPAPTPTMRPGGQGRDAHGCLTDGGYSWCEATGTCQRAWEADCPDTPAAPAPAPATWSGAISSAITSLTGGAICDMDGLSTTCAGTDPAVASFCTSDCFAAVAAMLPSCRSSMPQVAAELQPLANTCNH